jgi:beta-phosphoglucomutase-like phosphatase (HAD superfamily)
LFNDEYFNRVKAFPGARELLLKMRQAGLRIALAASADKEDLSKLKRVAIEDLVEEETASAEAGKSKPPPTSLRQRCIAIASARSRSNCLGRYPWDVRAAGKARVKTVAVASGQRPKVSSISADPAWPVKVLAAASMAMMIFVMRDISTIDHRVTLRKHAVLHWDIPRMPGHGSLSRIHFNVLNAVNHCRSVRSVSCSSARRD